MSEVLGLLNVAGARGGPLFARRGIPTNAKIEAVVRYSPTATAICRRGLGSGEDNHFMRTTLETAFFDIPGPPTWEHLLAMEKQVRAHLSERSGVEQHREWFVIIEQIMRGFVLDTQSGRPALKVPVELLMVMAGMSNSLSMGIVPEFITAVAEGSGRKVAGRLEDQHIGWATLYIMAAKLGRILDPNPINTIVTEYGVRRQTAQRWATRDVPPSLRRLLSEETIISEMKRSAQFYRKAGRSSQAIASRG